MNRWRLAANGATLANALVGVGAIAYVLLGNPLFATLLIAIGIGFDGLDGIFSRRAGTGGLFGRVADSVADALTFGLAPALLIGDHQLQHDPWATDALAAALVGALYLSLAVARLVYFTVNGYQRRAFVGVPTPQSALAIAWLSAAFFVPGFLGIQPTIFLSLSAVVALLMVVPLPFPKVRKGSVWRGPSAVTAIAAALMLVPLQFRPAPGSAFYTLALVAAAVMAGGLLSYYLLGPWTERRAALGPRQESERA